MGELRHIDPHYWPQRDHVLLVVPPSSKEHSTTTVVQAARCRGYDVCVVDDCSEDRTADNAADAGAHVLRMPVARGPWPVASARPCGVAFVAGSLVLGAYRWGCLLRAASVRLST